MTVKEACEFVLTFGQYNNYMLKDVAVKDINYLKWLNRKNLNKDCEDIDRKLKLALKIVLMLPWKAVKKEKISEPEENLIIPKRWYER